MNEKLLIINISKIYTSNRPKRGLDMNDVLLIEDGYIYIENQKIKEIGSRPFDHLITKDVHVFDAENKIALPGFIDSHTHLVHYGSRENEYKLKLQGVPYLDILKQGGGIHSTVKETRKATEKELFEKAYNSLNLILSYGVTTIETKSGYGLNKETEMKQLKVSSKLNQAHPIDIINTYLGAHAIPLEFSKNKEAYIQSVCSDMEEVKKQNLASFVDIFCEDSVFTKEDSKRILSKAKDLGFKTKIHADEIVSLGGTSLAVELDSISADHLMAVSDEDIKKIGDSNVVANLLPSTSFYLNKEYAPARKLINANAYLSISSDYNPGSSPSENFQFAMQIASNKLKLTPAEVLTASTINAAKCIGLEKEIGSLEVGKYADIILLDSPNLEYLFYHFATNHVTEVFKKGKLVIKDKKQLVNE